MTNRLGPEGELDPLIKILSEERKKRGWSILRVSRECAKFTVGEETSPASAQISVWELGNRLPSVTSLRRWAAGLGYELVLRRIETNGVKESESNQGTE